MKKYDKVLVGGDQCGYVIRSFKAWGRCLVRLHNGGYKMYLVDNVMPVAQFIEGTDRVLDGCGYSNSARRLVEIRIMVRGFIAMPDAWEQREGKMIFNL